jgi:putative toxin-antitoxin system antitoxin component (TIGR02293 family)
MEQSGPTSNLPGILAKATDAFGSPELAEEWLERPAVGLNQRRPIDLLGSPTGVALVETLLERMKYGVYT